MSGEIKLVIGNKNYSSWSLRAWLALRKAGVDFEEVLLPLDTPEFYQRIGAFSDSGRVPVLWHGGLCIWDSLSICEYINERFAEGGLWPPDVVARAIGRSMSAEMHSGFPVLRSELPMNIRAQRAIAVAPPLAADIQRIFELWSTSLSRYSDKGPWLLGEFSVVDAMFAPVAMRFLTYGITMPEDIANYVAHVDGDADMADWKDHALQEAWVVEADEAGADVVLD